MEQGLFQHTLQERLASDPAFREYHRQVIAQVLNKTDLTNEDDIRALVSNVSERALTEFYAPSNSSSQVVNQQPAAVASSYSEAGEWDALSLLGSLTWSWADTVSFGISSGILKRLGIEPDIDTPQEKALAAAGTVAGFITPGAPSILGGLRIGARAGSAVSRSLIKGSGGLVARGVRREVVGGATKAGTLAFKDIGSNVTKLAADVAGKAGTKLEGKLSTELTDFIRKRAIAVSTGREAIPMFGWQKGFKGIKNIGTKEFFDEASDTIVKRALVDSEENVAKMFSDHLGRALTGAERKAVMETIETGLRKGSVSNVEDLLTNRWGKLIAQRVRGALETSIEFGVFNMVQSTVHGVANVDWSDPDAVSNMIQEIPTGTLHGLQAGAVIGGVVKMIPNIFWASKHGAIDDIVSSHGLGGRVGMKGKAAVRSAEEARKIYGELLSDGFLLGDTDMANVLTKLKFGDNLVNKIPLFNKTLGRLGKWAANPSKLSDAEKAGVLDLARVNAIAMERVGRTAEAELLMAARAEGNIPAVLKLIKQDWGLALKEFRGSAYTDFVKNAIGMTPRVIASSIAGEPEFFMSLFTGDTGSYMAENGLDWTDLASSFAFATMMATHSAFEDPVLAKPKADPGRISYQEVRAMIAGAPIIRQAPDGTHLGSSSFGDVRVDNLGENLRGVMDVLHADPDVAKSLAGVKGAVLDVIDNKVDAGKPSDAFKPEVKRWLRRLGIDAPKDLSDGTIAAIEDVFRRFTPLDPSRSYGAGAMTFPRFDDYYFGQSLYKMSAAYRGNRKLLTGLLVTEQGNPINIQGDPQFASGEDLALIERANRAALAMGDGNPAVKTLVLDKKETSQEALQALRNIEADIRATWGENLSLESLPAIARFSDLAPGFQVHESYKDPAFFMEVPEKDPRAKIASWVKSVNELLESESGVIIAPEGDTPAARSARLIAQARETAGKGRLVGVGANEELMQKIEDEYSKLPQEARDIMESVEELVTYENIKAVAGGDVSRMAENVYRKLQFIGMSQPDRTTGIDLEAAAGVYAGEGQKWIKDFFADMYKSGLLKRPIVDAKMSEDMQDSISQLFSEMAITAGAESGTIVDRILSKAMYKAGFSPDYIDTISAMLTTGTNVEKSYYYNKLIEYGVITGDARGIVTAEPQITIVADPQKLRDTLDMVLQSQDRSPQFMLAEIGRMHTDVSDAGERFNITYGDVSRVRTVSDFLRHLGQRGDAITDAKNFTDIYFTEMFDAGRVPTEREIRIGIATSLVRAGLVKDPAWIDSVNNPGDAGPDLYRGISDDGKWIGEKVDPELISRLAVEMNSSMPGHTAIVKIISKTTTEKDKDGKSKKVVKYDTTVSTSPRIIPAGQSDGLRRLRKSGAEIYLMNRLESYDADKGETLPITDYKKIEASLEGKFGGRGLALIFTGDSSIVVGASYDPATGVGPLAQSLFKTETTAGAERFKIFDKGMEKLGYKDGKGLAFRSEYLSSAWLLSSVPTETMKSAMSSLESMAEFRKKTATRGKNILGINFKSSNFDQSHDAWKRLLSSDLAKRKTSDGSAWDGGLNVYFYDPEKDTIIARILKEAGLNRMRDDGALLLRQDVMFSVADMIGSPRSNGAKGNIYINDPDANKFYLDKPQMRAGEDVEAVIKKLSEALGEDVDVIAVGPSVKIKPDVIWGSNASLEGAISEQFSGEGLAGGAEKPAYRSTRVVDLLNVDPIAGSADKRAFYKDYANVRNIAIQSFDTHIAKSVEGYVGEIDAVGEFHNEIYKRRLETANELFAIGGAFDRLLAGDIDPTVLSDILKGDEYGVPIGEVSSDARGRNVLLRLISSMHISPVVLMHSGQFMDSIQRRYIERGIVRNEQRDSGSMVIADHLGAIDLDEIILPLEVINSRVRAETRFRISTMLGPYYQALSKGGENTLFGESSEALKGSGVRRVFIDRNAIGQEGAIEYWRDRLAQHGVEYSPENAEKLVTLHEIVHGMYPKAPEETTEVYEERITRIAAEHLKNGDLDASNLHKDYQPSDPEMWREILKVNGVAPKFAEGIAGFFSWTGNPLSYPGLYKLPRNIAGALLTGGKTNRAVLDAVEAIATDSSGNKSMWYHTNWRGLVTAAHSMPRTGMHDRKPMFAKRYYKDPLTRYAGMHHAQVTLLQRDVDADKIHVNWNLPEAMSKEIEIMSRYPVGSTAFNMKIGKEGGYSSFIEYWGMQNRFSDAIGKAANESRDFTWLAHHKLSMITPGGQGYIGGIFDGADNVEQYARIMRGDPVIVRVPLADGTVKDVEYRALVNVNGTMLGAGDARFVNVKAFTDAKKNAMPDYWVGEEWYDTTWYSVFPMFDRKTGDLIPFSDLNPDQAATWKAARQHLMSTYGAISRSLQADRPKSNYNESMVSYDRAYRILRSLLKPATADTKYIPRPAVDVKRMRPASGGAVGSDTMWYHAAIGAGVPNDNFTIHSPEDVGSYTGEFGAEASKAVILAAKSLGKNVPKSRAVYNLQARNYAIINDGDSVFAVGTMLGNGTVSGGTGWGIEMAKRQRKPIYVLSPEKARAIGGGNAWYTWNYATRRFEQMAHRPMLTESPALIGTRFKGDGVSKETVTAASEEIGAMFSDAIGGGSLTNAELHTRALNTDAANTGLNKVLVNRTAGGSSWPGAIMSGRHMVASVDANGFPVIENGTASERMTALLGERVNRMFSMLPEDVPQDFNSALSSPYKAIRDGAEEAIKRGISPEEFVTELRWRLLPEWTKGGADKSWIGGRAFAQQLHNFRDYLANEHNSSIMSSDMEVARAAWFKMSPSFVSLYDWDAMIRAYYETGEFRLNTSKAVKLLRDSMFSMDQASGVSEGAAILAKVGMLKTPRAAGGAFPSSMKIVDNPNGEGATIEGITIEDAENILGLFNRRAFDPSSFQPGSASATSVARRMWRAMGGKADGITVDKTVFYDSMLHMYLSMHHGIPSPGGAIDKQFALVPRYVYHNGEYHEYMMPMRAPSPIAYEHPEMFNALARLARKMNMASGNAFLNSPPSDSVTFYTSDSKAHVLSRKALLTATEGRSGALATIASGPSTGKAYFVEDFTGADRSYLEAALRRKSVETGHRADFMFKLTMNIQSEALRAEIKSGVLPNDNGIDSRVVLEEKEVQQALYREKC